MWKRNSNASNSNFGRALSAQSLAPINEVKAVLIHIRVSAKIVLYIRMANSTDPDETPLYAASHLGICYKCPIFSYVH